MVLVYFKSRGGSAPHTAASIAADGDADVSVVHYGVDVRKTMRKMKRNGQEVYIQKKGMER